MLWICATASICDGTLTCNHWRHLTHHIFTVINLDWVSNHNEWDTMEFRSENLVTFDKTLSRMVLSWPFTIRTNGGLFCNDPKVLTGMQSTQNDGFSRAILYHLTTQVEAWSMICKADYLAYILHLWECCYSGVDVESLFNLLSLPTWAPMPFC